MAIWPGGPRSKMSNGVSIKWSATAESAKELIDVSERLAGETAP